MESIIKETMAVAPRGHQHCPAFIFAGAWKGLGMNRSGQWVTVRDRGGSEKGSSFSILRMKPAAPSSCSVSLPKISPPVVNKKGMKARQILLSVEIFSDYFGG